MTASGALAFVNEQLVISEDYERRFARLSRREVQVLLLVVNGLLNKQVAAELGISPITVQIHRRHVMQKMQARSFAELVRMTTILQFIRTAHQFSA